MMKKVFRRIIRPYILLALLLLLVIPTGATGIDSATTVTAQNAAALGVSATIGYGQASAAAESPDRTRVAMATVNGVWLFDPLYQQAQQLHIGRANAVAWRFDSSEVAAALADGTVRVWDVRSGAERLRIDAHQPTTPDEMLAFSDEFEDGVRAGGAVAVRWSPDGTQLISGGSDGMVNIWESRNGASFFALSGHTAPVTAVTLSPFGRLTSASAAEVFIWNTMTGQPEAIDGYHTVAAWSADARYLLTQAGFSLVVLDGETRDSISRFPADVPTGIVSWSPQTAAFAYAPAGDSAPALRLLDAWTGLERGELDTDGGQPFALAWSADGARLSAWLDDGRMMTWTTFDSNRVQEAVGWARGDRVVWSPTDSDQIALTDGGALSLVWDVAANRPMTDAVPDWATAPPTTETPPARIIAGDDGALSLVVYEAGTETVSASYATPFRQMTDATGAEVPIVATPAGDVLAGSVVFETPVGETVYALVLWSATDGTQLIQSSAHTAPIISLGFSADGGYLATLDAAGTAYVWTVRG